MNVPGMVRLTKASLNPWSSIGLTRRDVYKRQVHIDGEVWHLDVGSSHPGAGVGPKGSAVRRLKWYASWVQNVVRQFGPYLLWALDI